MNWFDSNTKIRNLKHQKKFAWLLVFSSVSHTIWRMIEPVTWFRFGSISILLNLLWYLFVKSLKVWRFFLILQFNFKSKFCEIYPADDVWWNHMPTEKWTKNSFDRKMCDTYSMRTTTTATTTKTERRTYSEKRETIENRRYVYTKIEWKFIWNGPHRAFEEWHLKNEQILFNHEIILHALRSHWYRFDSFLYFNDFKSIIILYVSSSVCDYVRWMMLFLC